jgi:hypothetical protein
MVIAYYCGMPRSGLQTLGHEQAERVVIVAPERLTVLIAGCAIESDRLGLPYTCLQADAIDVLLPRSIFQCMKQAST